MADTATDTREDEVTQLRARLAELEADAGDEVQEVIADAEDAALETAEQVTSDTQDAHEDIHEAEQEVEETVHEEAQAAAEDIGHPEQADAIAEHLFRMLDERGLLPHTQHHSISPIPPAEEIVHSTIDTPAEVLQETAEAVDETANQAVSDIPPEPQHWYFKPRLRFGKR